MSAFDPKRTLGGAFPSGGLSRYHALSSGSGAPMRRRDFISLLGGVTAIPFAARAQQTAKTHRIALVHPSVSIADMSESGGNSNYAALFKELRRLGYIEGVNLVVTRYSGEGQEERFPELCREIVRTKPDVIVAASTRLVLSFKAATDTVPVVGAMGDPVPVGIVANIARPGGNITGVSSVAGPEIWGKRLQVLREAVPTSSKVGFLASRQLWSLPSTDVLRKAAQQLGISLLGPPSKARSKPKNIAALWGQWRRSMSMQSSSVIKQKTAPTGSLLLIWCGPPSCQRFSPSASILKLGRSWCTALRFQMFTADLRLTSTRF
jgi:ABC transporter substrate binding protein